VTKAPLPLTSKTDKYRTILIYPPWGVKDHVGSLGGAQAHYPLLSVDRLKSLPVGDLASDNAHLWLWATNATLGVAHDLIGTRGFVARSPLTWIKPLGVGQYLRNATEHLILGTRGRAPVKFRSQPRWLFAPPQDHSYKPEEQYATSESISDGPYLELFARRRQPGWDAWGNEIDSDIVIPAFLVPSDRPHCLGDATST